MEILQGPVPAKTKKLKVVVMGDTKIGKTCCVRAFAFRSTPRKYDPTAVDYIPVNVAFNGTPYTLGIRDTGGLEYVDYLRPEYILWTDVFLVCFSTVSPESFNNVRSKWLPEITRYSPRSRFIIVGTQKDLRRDAGVVADLAKNNLKPITRTQGKRLAKELNAKCYVECSALTFKGITKVFEEGIRVVVNPPKNKECVIC